MDLEELRRSMFGTHNLIYMNTGWAGPSPPIVLSKIQEALEMEARLGPGSIEWLEFADQLGERARKAAGSLLNVRASDLLLTHSTREAVNVVFHGLKWETGDELLICDLEHIAITIPAQVLAQRFGIRIVCPIIPCQADPSEVIEILKRSLTPKTRLVALSHIQFSCGLKMPIKEISKMVHDQGIPLLVDGAQSVGQMPVDLLDLDCDFYTMSGQKWLLGPAGTGLLFVNDQYHNELQPLLTTHAVEEARPDSTPGLARFSLASRNPALIAGITASMRLALEIGIERIEQRITALASLLRQHLQSIPVTLLSPRSEESASGLVTVSVNNWSPLDLVKVLETQFRIIVRDVENPSGIRFSVSHFSTENDVDAVALALKQLKR